MRRENKNMQPTIIGITMSYDKKDLINKGVSYSYIRQEYGKQVRAAGGQPVFLDSSMSPAVAARLCNGIIISGGEDIDPSFYGQKMRGAKDTEPTERTLWERELIKACDKRKRHILGICYGAQLLNVHYGGTLHQDIAADVPGSVSHGTSKAAAMNTVLFERDALGFRAKETVATAHRHHQAVNVLAPGFRVVARAEDGVIEAIAGRGHFGFQWHSESDGTAPKIYGTFVSLCTVAPPKRTFGFRVHRKDRSLV